MGPRAPVGHGRLDRPQCGDCRRGRYRPEKTQSADATAPRWCETAAAVGYIGLETGPMMLKKRSFTLSGHRTSVALEAEFWAVLDDCAGREALSLAALV